MWETYGAQKVCECGAAVMASLQQAEVLQQGVHEKGFQSKTEEWDELDDGSLPCPTVVAEWIMRDMRKQQERGCTPQGRESTEQQFGQFAKSVSKLSQQNPSSCEEVFNMWEEGKRIWLLREALSEIQKIRKSVHCLWEGGDRMRCKSRVRRLTPL